MTNWEEQSSKYAFTDANLDEALLSAWPKKGSWTHSANFNQPQFKMYLQITLCEDVHMVGPNFVNSYEIHSHKGYSRQ